jgi:predicted acetyltransferase
VDVEIRTIAGEEFDPWMRAMARAFSEYPHDDWLEMERKLIEPDRTFAALDGDEFVGGASTATMRLTVPGAEASIAGVTGVGVAPTHRRRGVATGLMRRQLDHVRERGAEPIAALHASEAGIYGRFGYGIASFECAMDVDRVRTAFLRRPEEVGRVRLLDREAAFESMRPVYDAVSQGQPGFIGRDDLIWDARFRDLERDRDGASPYFYAVHEGPDGVDAYAVYRFKHDWPQSAPEGIVDVEEVMAVSPDALALMWRFVFDIDLAGRIRCFSRPVDDPLLGLLAEPRRLRLMVRDGLWARIVDVPGALEARRYAAEASLVLDVRDVFCPWNDGRYRVDVGPDGGECSPTREAADLILGASELGAAYLGGTRLGQLARAGRVDEERAGALRRADLAFSWDPAPWCADMF